MSDTRDLALDLHHLWYTAKSLREMGGAHTSASTTVSGCTPESALSRPASVGLGSSGFFADWASLRDQVVEVLHTNARSLNDTADALDLCVADFVGTDDAVRQELDDLKTEIPYE